MLDKNQSRVYHYLKHHQGATLEEISVATKLPYASVREILDAEVKKDLIEIRTSRTYDISGSPVTPQAVIDKYFVKIVLHGWKDRRAPKAIWSYPEIRGRTPMPKAGVVPAPDIYRNPLRDKLIRFFQGKEGDCVAAAGMYIRELIYMMLTGQIIEGEVLRDQTYGRTVYDRRPGFSVACIYIECKKRAHINLASPGCYVSFGAEAMTKFGVCLDEQWYCAKDGTTFWTTPYPDTMENVAAMAAQHKIDGYALLNPTDPPDLALFRQVLSEKGCLYGAIPIYENFMDAGKNAQGEYISDLPDPKGPIIGWHALAWTGYNKLTKRFEHESSWEGWTPLGSVSERYLLTAIGDFLAILDASEVVIGQEIFLKVAITCNVPATVTIDGAVAGTTPLTVRLEKGKTYHMKFEAKGYVTKEEDVLIIDADIIVTLSADTPPTPPQPEDPLWRKTGKWILAFFVAIWNAIRGKS